MEVSKRANRFGSFYKTNMSNRDRGNI